MQQHQPPQKIRPQRFEEGRRRTPDSKKQRKGQGKCVLCGKNQHQALGQRRGKHTKAQGQQTFRAHGCKKQPRRESESVRLVKQQRKKKQPSQQKNTEQQRHTQKQRAGTKGLEPITGDRLAQKRLHSFKGEVGAPRNRKNPCKISKKHCHRTYKKITAGTHLHHPFSIGHPYQTVCDRKRKYAKKDSPELLGRTLKQRYLPKDPITRAAFSEVKHNDASALSMASERVMGEGTVSNRAVIP